MKRVKRALVFFVFVVISWRELVCMKSGAVFSAGVAERGMRVCLPPVMPVRPTPLAPWIAGPINIFPPCVVRMIAERRHVVGREVSDAALIQGFLRPCVAALAEANVVLCLRLSGEWCEAEFLYPCFIEALLTILDASSTQSGGSVALRLQACVLAVKRQLGRTLRDADIDLLLAYAKGISCAVGEQFFQQQMAQRIEGRFALSLPTSPSSEAAGLDAGDEPRGIPIPAASAPASSVGYVSSTPPRYSSPSPLPPLRRKHLLGYVEEFLRKVREHGSLESRESIEQMRAALWQLEPFSDEEAAAFRLAGLDVSLADVRGALAEMV